MRDEVSLSGVNGGYLLTGGGDDVGRVASLLSVGLNHGKRGPGDAIKVLACVFVLFHHYEGGRDGREGMGGRE